MTISRSELPKIVLRTEDTPRWSQFENAEQTRSDAHAGPRQDPTRFGREEGWISRFRSASTDNPLVVESRADLFGSVVGAKKDLSAYRDELKAGIVGSGATAKLLRAPDLGDGAVAGELRQGPQVFYVVAWRRSNATASVTVQGTTATTHLSDAVRLARRQDEHLSRAAASPL